MADKQIKVTITATDRATPVLLKSAGFVQIFNPDDVVGLPDETEIFVNGVHKTAGDYNRLVVAGTPLLEALVAIGHSVWIKKDA